MMTKELLETQIKEAKKLLADELNKLKPIREQISELEDALLNLRIGSELITDLTPYSNKCLEHIRAFDSNYEEVYLPNETCKVTPEGRLECTSYAEGIVSYSSKAGCYVRTVYGHESELDIVGFIDIKVEE